MHENVFAEVYCPKLYSLTILALNILFAKRNEKIEKYNANSNVSLLKNISVPKYLESSSKNVPGCNQPNWYQNCLVDKKLKRL